MATHSNLKISVFWRRKWQPTPGLLPGKSYEWRSLVGYSPWDGKELDMTEQLPFTPKHWNMLFLYSYLFISVCARPSSLCRLFSGEGVWASHCGGLSC